MSGYLSRLAMRSQTNQPTSSLQPFVRSTSPIAQQDQRLGLSGYESIGQQGIPTSLLDSEEVLTANETIGERSTSAQNAATSAADGLSPDLVFPAISTDSSALQQSSQQINTQRKATDTSPVVDSVPSSVSPVASPLPRSNTSLSPANNRFSENVFTETDGVLECSEAAQGLSGSASEPFPVEGLRPPIQRETQAALFSEEAAEKVHSPSDAANTVAVRTLRLPEASFPNSVASPPFEKTDFEQQAREKVEQSSVAPDDVRAGSLLRERSESVPSLAPAIRSRVAANNAMFEAAASEDGYRPAGPAVVIGRINVEVVAPP
ncbi:MAG: hypothetical protein AAGC93_27025, partial [Cyanobacteria bacterium P01_F01_bin.53]